MPSYDPHKDVHGNEVKPLEETHPHMAAFFKMIADGRDKKFPRWYYAYDAGLIIWQDQIINPWLPEIKKPVSLLDSLKGLFG
jgi:hypothetical protein